MHWVVMLCLCMWMGESGGLWIGKFRMVLVMSSKYYLGCAGNKQVVVYKHFLFLTVHGHKFKFILQAEVSFY